MYTFSIDLNVKFYMHLCDILQEFTLHLNIYKYSGYVLLYGAIVYVNLQECVYKFHELSV